MMAVLRYLLLVLVLDVVACAPRKRPKVYSPLAERSAEQTRASSPAAPPEDDPTPDRDTGTTTDDPPTAAPSGAGGHCLYVGAEQRAVRCYWKREDCAYQIKFNDGLGNKDAQECKAVSALHCMKPGDGGELCYPTTDACSQTVANMKKRNRKTSECTVKASP